MVADNIRPAPRFIGVTGAVLLISTSAALGAYYGFAVGSQSHVLIGVALAAAAFGGELLKPLAVAAALDALAARQAARALLSAALAAVCILYSFASELSLAAGGRGDLAAGRQAVADTARASRERRTRAEAELTNLPVVRPEGTLRPLVAKLSAELDGADCEDPKRNSVRRTCAEIAGLKSEIGTAERRKELEATVADASAPAGTAVIAADPLASALSAYATAAGHEIAPEVLMPWLALIPVLFLEFGSALALVVVRSLDAPKPGAQDDTAAPEASPAPSTGPTRPRTPRGPKPGNKARLGANIIDLLKARGGTVVSGQRDLARDLGLSKSRVNELLSELAASGQVLVAPSREGTRIELVAA